MASAEKYFWVCDFEFHGQNYSWWAYFQDQSEAEGFLQQIIEMLPCISLSSLVEYKQGLIASGDYYHYRLSDQLATSAQLKLKGIKGYRYFGQPAPIVRDYVSSFLCDLRKFQPCIFCVASLPEIDEIVLTARRRRKRA